MTPMHYAVLIVDDDQVIRESLVSYLKNYHEADYVLDVEASADVAQAQEKLAHKNFHLVISDINLPNQDGFSLLNDVHERFPDTKTALITAYKVEDYVRTAKKTGIFNIIAKTAPFNFEELSTVVHNLLQPESAFHLSSYLEPETSLTEFVITNSDQIMEAFFALREFFTQSQVNHVDDLSTAMIEAITNAVYHVAKLPDGSLKYQKGQQIEALEESEYVYIRYGKDEERIGVSITDQGGRITADEILYWLDRNISGAGLLDTHGRGVYLIHTLVDRMIINISPGHRTEIIVLDYFKDDFSSNKPLYINQV